MLALLVRMAGRSLPFDVACFPVLSAWTLITRSANRLEEIQEEEEVRPFVEAGADLVREGLRVLPHSYHRQRVVGMPEVNRVEVDVGADTDVGDESAFAGGGGLDTWHKDPECKPPHDGIRDTRQDVEVNPQVQSETSRLKQPRQLQQPEHGPPSFPSSSFSSFLEVWSEEAGEDEVGMVVGVVKALSGLPD